MGVYIKNMDKPEDCWVCFYMDCPHLGEIGYENTAECSIIEVRDDYFKYYLECERLNDSRDILKHGGCMGCDVKSKCLYAFTPEAEECNHYGERRTDE